MISGLLKIFTDAVTSFDNWLATQATETKRQLGSSVSYHLETSHAFEGKKIILVACGEKIAHYSEISLGCCACDKAIEKLKQFDNGELLGNVLSGLTTHGALVTYLIQKEQLHGLTFATETAVQNSAPFVPPLSPEEAEALALSVMFVHSCLSKQDILYHTDILRNEAIARVTAKMFPNAILSQEAYLERKEEFNSMLLDEYTAYRHNEWCPETHRTPPPASFGPAL